MRISFAEEGEQHHYLGNIKIRLEATAKTKSSLAYTKDNDKMSPFKMRWNQYDRPFQ